MQEIEFGKEKNHIGFPLNSLISVCVKWSEMP